MMRWRRWRVTEWVRLGWRGPDGELLGSVSMSRDRARRLADLAGLIWPDYEASIEEHHCGDRDRNPDQVDGLGGAALAGQPGRLGGRRAAHLVAGLAAGDPRGAGGVRGHRGGPGLSPGEGAGMTAVQLSRWKPALELLAWAGAVAGLAGVIVALV